MRGAGRFERPPLLHKASAMLLMCGGPRASDELHTLLLMLIVVFLAALVPQVNRRLNRLIVVDGHGRLVGVCSRGDIMRATLEHFRCGPRDPAEHNHKR